LQFPFFKVRRDGDNFIIAGQVQGSFGTPTKFSTGVGGIFANWEWEDNELTAEVDPYGIFSLFYCQTKDGVMLSTSPLQLISIGAPPDIDRVALASFHLVGWYFNEDTAFKNVKVLPPNGRLTWRDGKLTVTGRPKIKNYINIDKDSAVKEYERLFSSAVSSCWKAAATEPMIVPLSGGRDSRHILLESIRQGYRPEHCVTYDPTFREAGAYDPEWHCAKQITELFNLKHEKIKTLQSKHAEQLRTIYLAHLGTDEHVQLLSLARHLSGKSALDGIGGDTLSRNKNVSTNLTRAMKSADRVSDLLAHFDQVSGNTVYERIVGTDLDETDVKHARQSIIDCYESYSDQTDKNCHFMFWQRTRRETGLAPGALLSTASNVFCPYLDPELAEFCLSLPDEVTADGDFHDRVIQHSFPDIDIPYHDQLKRILPAPPLTAKARAIGDAVLAKSSIGIGAMMREPFHQARMLMDKKYKSLYFWRTYHEVIQSL
jgi:asparagine synthetase B (glutamine-hydrolysing)